MKQKHGIGYQSYEEMMLKNIFYIDKTLLIRDWWECADKVTLITRPRRFGKTLNMSMVECFFSNKYACRKDLFEGKAIWKEENFRQLQGTYPVIFMSFANAKTTNDTNMTEFEEMKTIVKQIITDVYDSYAYLMDSDIFCEKDRGYFASVSKDMDDLTASMSINTLCSYLERYYGKKAIILLDEYDTPMQEAWLYGYRDSAVRFSKTFLV